MTIQVERAHGLEALGIVRSGRVHWNLSPAALYEESLRRGEAQLAVDGTGTGVFIVLHPSRSEVVIGGTFYAGEIKKSIFTVMNDRLPLEGVFPMHCSANVGPDGDVAIFFGLSGTGKTTLSADPARSLIGDDEHGWGSNGVFNVEGGCYAKVIRLSAEAEPDIFRTTHTLSLIHI